MKDGFIKILFASVSVALPVHGQGTFQNLNFESATIPTSTPASSLVPISDALPGWSAYFTSGVVTQPQGGRVLRWHKLGGYSISLVDSKVTTPVDGNYSAFLFGGGNNPLYSASISQTGTVPAGTQSLQFDGYVFGAPFTVTLGGQTINMAPLQTFAHYTLWGGNMPSSVAGQTETLTFTEPPEPPGSAQPSMFELDDISFSPNAVVPEPIPLALIAIGRFLFVLHRRIASRLGVKS